MLEQEYMARTRQMELLQEARKESLLKFLIREYKSQLREQKHRNRKQK